MAAEVEANPSVSTIPCPACGAPAPVGQGDRVQCAFCGAEVEAPREARDLRAAQAQDEAARQAAERLFATLDSPPWLITEVLAAALDLPMIAFWLLFGIPVGLGAISMGLAADKYVARWGHYGSPDAVPFWITVVIIVASLVLVTFVPRALGVYASRRASARGALVAALAAKFPQGPGGAARCHHCAATLTVPAGAVVVTCPSCSSDNAVQIKTTLLSAAVSAAKRETRSVKDAARIDALERAETRWKLARELGRYLFRAALFAAMFIGMNVDEERMKAHGESGVSGLGAVCIIGIVVALIYFMIKSMSDAVDEQAKRERRERASGRRVPAWAGPVGAIVMAVLLFKGLGLVFRLLL